MEITTKYIVMKQAGMFRLDVVKGVTYSSDVPSSPWWGDDPEEGQRAADIANAELIRLGKIPAEHVAMLRASRREWLGLAP